jgi:AcrR family transcriptional regulator
MIRNKKKTTISPTTEVKTPIPRNRGKDDRRARLICAARDLISEREDGNFSMQELATRAGLSLATPYNLMGSKAAILQEVYRAETEGFRRSYHFKHPKAPVERLMSTAENIVAVFARSPRFYRNLSRNLPTLEPGKMRTLIVPMTYSLFQPLVEELFAEGFIASEHVSPIAVTTHLQRYFESTFQHWAVLGWSEDDFRRELRAGFALTFLGLFHGAAGKALLIELAAYQAPTA